MNFYKRHLGDYTKDTAHLTLIEHGAYTMLLDLYYSTEKPFPDDLKEICRKVRARTPEERAAVASVLREFFHKQARRNQHEGRTVWFQRRADSEILEYKRWVKVGKINGLKGGRPKTQNNHTPSEGITQNNHSHTHTQEPLAVSQKIQNQDKPRVQNPHAPFTPDQQARNRKAKEYREQKESEMRQEVQVGQNWISDQIVAIGAKKAL